VGLYTTPRRDYRFMTPYEKEWDRSFALAMAAMRDPRTDESQMLGESVVDDISDLLDLLCGVDETNSADYGHRLLLLSRKHKEAVAESEAEKACETIPSERAA
jgi:hypothetical protein